MKQIKGFTLIELLIVVAIIAILAAIAVPNFLEAQVRSKVSRTKADMRSTATAMEAYAVDYRKYPRGNNYQTGFPLPSWGIPQSGNSGLLCLTTPVAYITTLFRDPFGCKDVKTGNGPFNTVSPSAEELDVMEYYGYSARDALGTVAMTVSAPDGSPDSNSPGGTSWWILQASGPDGCRYTMGSSILPTFPTNPNPTLNRCYDSTNGTVSLGSVFRIGGSIAGDSIAGAQMLDRAGKK